MPKAAVATSSSTPSTIQLSAIPWRPTKIMNMRDLSKDDDFLSHLLVEKLGTGDVPLYVHKMDSSRKFPKTDANDLLQIVRRLGMNKAPVQTAIRQAVDELLLLPAVRYYLKSYEQKQINAFATHASRYFELYLPSGSIEIAHTSRYAHRTGKSELCILATRNLFPGVVITELKGSMANLTEEEDRELKRNLNNGDVRRDFSVIHSKQMKKNHLFLGPARFVNHDCDHNCELFREGKYITFRVLRQISIGEEITAHYGDGYFGKKNRHCLCETCEKNGRGGYAPDYDENEPEPNSSSDSDVDSSSSLSDSELERPDVNVNERRTRRGVYAVLPKVKRGKEDNDEDAKGSVKAAIELAIEVEAGSTAPGTPLDLDGTPLHAVSNSHGAITRSCSSLSSLSSDTSNNDEGRTPATALPTVIATCRRKDKMQLLTISSTESVHTPPRRETRSLSAMQSSEKGKGREVTPVALGTPTSRRNNNGKDETKVKKEEVEPRILRTRIPAPQPNDPPKAPSPKEVPRGPDGKPLPLCVTCNNVLPVISVDSKVVWGLGLENSPKRKRQKLQCPRCMRHFAIYAQPWPSRLLPNGHSPSFLPTPRDGLTPTESAARRVTHQVLPMIDKKLQQAAAAVTRKESSKRRNQSQNCDEEPPMKRAKIGTSHETPKSQEVQGNDVVATNDAAGSSPPKRKRGRPRIHFPEAKQQVKIKQEEMSMSLSDKLHCLNGPKGDTGNINFSSPSKVASHGPRQKKRAIDIDEKDHPRKLSLRGHVNNVQESAEVSEDIPLQKVLPRPTNFRSTMLLSKPNPLCFALQAWGGPVIVEDSSSDEDDKGVATPDDNQSPPAAMIVSPDDILPQMSPSPIYDATPIVPRGALIFKPSPITFAKRRWASVSSDSPSPMQDSPLESTTDFEQAQTNDSSDQYASLYYRPGRGADEMSDETDDPSRVDQDYDLLFHPITPRGTPGFHKSVGFPLPDSTPNFIRAGWDSPSELSDS